MSRRRSLALLLAGRVYPEEQMLALMERRSTTIGHYAHRCPRDLLPGVRHLLEAVRAADGKIAQLGQSERPRGGAAAAHRVLSTPWPMGIVVRPRRA